MAPSPKPKKSKKQKQKEKQADLEQLAEEQRLAEAAELERQEKLRIQQEEEECERKVKEAQLQAELDERLALEDKENADAYQTAALELDKQRTQALQDIEWQRFIQCDQLPEIGSQPSVNAFITDWRETAKGDVWTTLEECELGHKLRDELLLDAAAAVDRRDGRQAEWQCNVEKEVGHICQTKVDAATADFLLSAEGYANAKNEVICQICKPRCKFGLWVNLAKNPRVRSIDFTELQISTELPKSLALASIAIRAMHFTMDRLTPDSLAPTEPATAAYLTLGGVLCLELLTLPPAAKKVKGWNMRQVTELSTTVHRQPYPIPAEGGAVTTAGSAPALRISYALPRNVIVPVARPSAGWFDQVSGCWKLDGVSDVTFDEETRHLSFVSTRLTSLALLQRTDVDFPYKNWLFTPIDPHSGKLFVQTQRFPLEFGVSAQGCELVGPPLSELTTLLNRPMAPARLLMLLRKCGLNLCPVDADATCLEGIVPKSADVEEELYDKVVDLFPLLQVAPSKWNTSLGADKVTFRFAPKKDPLELELKTLANDSQGTKRSPFDVVESSWQTMVLAHRYVALIKALDSDAVCDIGVLEGMQAHSTPLLSVREMYPELVHELSHTSKLYLDTCRQLLSKLRLLSFTH